MAPSESPALFRAISTLIFFVVFISCSVLVSAIAVTDDDTPLVLNVRASEDITLDQDSKGVFSSIQKHGHGGPPAGQALEQLQGLVGVTYRPATRDAPPPKDVVMALIGYSIPRVRLLDPDAEAISAFVDSQIDLNLSLESMELFLLMASNVSAVQKWFTANVMPYSKRLKISCISVGYGILTRHFDKADLMVPAVKNVIAACKNLGLQGISISTAHSFNIMSDVFPPSFSVFNATYVPYLKELLALDAARNGAFQIDTFPFRVFHQRLIKGASITNVMFEARQDQYLTDDLTKLQYRNMYDMMVDSVIGALAALGYPYMPILVVGTGWPSEGNLEEVPEATSLFAAEYNERLVVRLNMYPGTPLRPSVTPVTYLFNLLDEKVDEDNPNSFENKWGILNMDLTHKYHIDFRSRKASTETTEEIDASYTMTSGSPTQTMQTVITDWTRWMLLCLCAVTTLLSVL